MVSTLSTYPDYRDSGVPWLGKIPADWSAALLKHISAVQLSNVDKLSQEGEEPVLLCNYVDVYKNDYITDRIEFMRATASREEIESFSIQQGDVLITKDSEAWNDIGVPALVISDVPGLLCGYHLAMVRPDGCRIQGEYLMRALSTPIIATQFHISANGITRYGVSLPDIKSTVVPLPPLDEQAAIVNYLAHVDHKINRFIRAKRRMIELLNEQKQALIHQAVTKGLDPDVPMKDSGVEWLGEIPAHWEVRRGKYYFREVDERSVDGSEELLSVSHLTGVTPRSEKQITMFKAESYVGHKLARPTNIVANTMWLWMAAVGVASMNGIVSPSYATYRLLDDCLYDTGFLDLLLRVPTYKSLYHSRSTGIRSSRLRLYPEQFLDIRFIRPPLAEQRAIVEYIVEQTSNLTEAQSRTSREIDLIREYRTRLVSDVVTGKVDVREAAAGLPEIEAVLEEADARGHALALDEPDSDDVAGIEKEGDEAW